MCSAYKLINIYFICKNDSPLIADRATNIHCVLAAATSKTNRLHGESHLCVPVPAPRDVEVNLHLHLSGSPALAFSLTSVDPFEPVTSLCWLWSFKSYRRIINFFPPFFQFSWLTFLGVLIWQREFPRNARKTLLLRCNTGSTAQREGCELYPGGVNAWHACSCKECCCPEIEKATRERAGLW